MAYLYTIELPDADAQSADDSIGANIQQSGLLEQGGTATTQIATDNVDLTIRGQWRYGERFSRKAARELESLAAGSYEALPLFGPGDTEVGSETGFYEIESVDVSPVHPDQAGKDAYEFTAGLSNRGTRETHWRAIRTTVETVDTLFAGNDSSLIAVPATAEKTQWYDSTEGPEWAQPVDTVEAEFGDLERYDPADASFANPTLLYETGFDDEAPVDVRVYDDRYRKKFWTFQDSDGDEVNVNQWPHVFHTGWEFAGTPVIDTGRLRIWFGVPEGHGTLTVETGETYTIPAGETEVWEDADVADGGEIDVQGELILVGDVGLYAERWDPGADAWEHVPLPDTSWSVVDVDFTAIGPGEVTMQLLWTDGAETARVDGIIDRGADSVLWVAPSNEPYKPVDTYELSVPAGETFTVESGETYRYATLSDIDGTLDVQGTLVGRPSDALPVGVDRVLAPLARETDTNIAPARTVVARSETRS